MLSRLSIRQKLSLLLVIPLTAVGLVMAGYAVERLNDARDHGTTARSALAARNIGSLIDTLQQERLLSVGYLAVPTLQRTALVSLTQTAVDDTVRLGADPLTAPIIRNARAALDGLTPIRLGVINRSIAAKTAYDAFRAVMVALIDGLNLGNDLTPDADSLRELVALDALMRANEEASSVGAILIAGSVDPALNASLLTEAAAADAQLLGRFSHLARPELASLVDTMEVGQAGQRIHHLVVDVTGGHPPAQGQEMSEALGAALTYTGLRRLAQDRIARDVADGAEKRATDAEVTAAEVVIGIIILFVGVVVLGVTVTRSISRPLRRLSRAATVVAELSRQELVRVADADPSEQQAPPQLASVEVDSADEIGELAAALNRVQATAALLLERQVTTRTNVAVMFANIARRTQNLVGRQLSLIDELERNERDPELLQRLYRLDHVATRLRRSADSLLVVSGTIDQQLSGTPTRIADIIRSALAEIEGYRAVELGAIVDVAVNADLVADLRLLLAELLENATNFSPPGTPVEVTAVFEHDLYVSVEDHGLGLSAARLEEENRRLVERERLDVAPTRVLGLFVVGRLARRHGLAVRLDASSGRGVTATVRIPQARLSRPLTDGGPRVAPVPSRPAPALGVVPPMAIEAMQAAERTGPFPWLAPPTLAIGAEPDESLASVIPADEAEAPAVPDENLDQTWPGGVATAPPSWPPTPASGGDTVTDVDAAVPLPRRAVSETTDAISLASNSPVSGVVENSDEAAGLVASPGSTRSGLSRRIPGTHLAEAVGDTIDLPMAPRSPRDPEAERDALNDYLSGLARGTAGPDEELESRPTTLAERHS